MQLGNRLFPYPVLNNVKELSQFKDSSSFELKMALNENGEITKTRSDIVLKDIYFSLNDETLLNLYNDNKIKCYLIVESSASIKRKKKELTLNPQTFTFPLGDFKEDVYISAYLIAACDIDGYRSDAFDEDYKDYSFDIKKYDILAADDGFKFVIDRNLDEDNKVSSIFVIAKSISDLKIIKYEMNADKIYIYLPSEQREKYDQLKVDSRWNDIFFSMIAIPVLTSCFFDLKNKFNCNEDDVVDINDIYEEYRWFKSVMKSYRKEKGQELDGDIFSSLPPMELAQIVLNYSSVSGLTNFCNLVISGNVGGEEDE